MHYNTKAKLDCTAQHNTYNCTRLYVNYNCNVIVTQLDQRQLFCSDHYLFTQLLIYYVIRNYVKNCGNKEDSIYLQRSVAQRIEIHATPHQHNKKQHNTTQHNTTKKNNPHVHIHNIINNSNKLNTQRYSRIYFKLKQF